LLQVLEDVLRRTVWALHVRKNSGQIYLLLLIYFIYYSLFYNCNLFITIYFSSNL
jgi:hypothetical protein